MEDAFEQQLLTKIQENEEKQRALKVEREHLESTLKLYVDTRGEPRTAPNLFTKTKSEAPPARKKKKVSKPRAPRAQQVGHIIETLIDEIFPHGKPAKAPREVARLVREASSEHAAAKSFNETRNQTSSALSNNWYRWGLSRGWIDPKDTSQGFEYWRPSAWVKK